GIAAQPLNAEVHHLFQLLDSFEEKPSGSQGLWQLEEIANRASDAVRPVMERLEAIEDGLNALVDTVAKEKRLKTARGCRGELRNLSNALWSAAQLYREE